MEKALSHYNGAMGRIWVQPDGPNTEPVYLGCHELGDVTAPMGDITRTHCPSRKRHGAWNVSTRSKGPPGEITTTITTAIDKVAGYLEKQVCPLPVYVLQSECGVPDVLLDYERGQVLQASDITNVTDSNLAQREGNDESTQAFDFSISVRERFWWMVLTALLSTEAEGANDIAFLMTERCAGDCGPALTPCTIGYVVHDTDVVEKTVNGGATWAATDAEPFESDEDISSVVVFPMANGGHRVMVSRGTTDAAAHAEIAYSDDLGATWTNVLLDTEDADFTPRQGGLFSLGYHFTWCVTNLGECHFSRDGGVSWVEQSTGKATALNHVNFIDHLHGIIVGAGNVVLYTDDGGDHWTDIGGSATQNGVIANCCVMVSDVYWFVGYADGELWYTDDGGTNWYERTVSTPSGLVSTDAINDIQAVDPYCLAMAVDWTDGDTADRGAIHRSWDGGYDWEVYPLPTLFDADGTPGLQALWMCDYNKVFAVGDPIASLAAIYIAEK